VDALFLSAREDGGKKDRHQKQAAKEAEQSAEFHKLNIPHYFVPDNRGMRFFRGCFQSFNPQACRADKKQIIFFISRIQSDSAGLGRIESDWPGFELTE